MTQIIVEKETTLFHGTCEKINGELRGGGFDRILWTSYQSTIAQNYIPAAGIKIYLKFPTFKLDDFIYPMDTMYEIAQKMGYEAIDVEYDQFQRPRSWAWKYEKRPKYQDILDYLQKELGYSIEDEIVTIKCSLSNEGLEIFPADYRKLGKLFIINPKENLNIFDYASARDGDLRNPDYLKLDFFAQLKDSGYDGVKINDWTQSEYHGNFGHKSIGLFPTGIEKLSMVSIPAYRYEWNDINPFEDDSPEYVEWLNNNI